MSNECKICEGTRKEPGELGCVWCDDTGKAGGLKPAPSNELAAFRAYMAANPMATYWSTWQERAKLGAAPAKCDGNHGGPRCADPECWNDVDPVSAPIRLGDLDPAQRLELARGEPERPAAASMLRQYVSKASFAHGADRHAAIQLIEELQQRLTDADEQLDAQRLRADTAEAELKLANERLTSAKQDPDVLKILDLAQEAIRSGDVSTSFEIIADILGLVSVARDERDDYKGSWKRGKIRIAAAEQRIASIAGKSAKCKECGSDALFWFDSNTNTSGIMEGRLRTNEVTCTFVLGCADCSATIKTVRAETIAARMTAALNPNPEAESHEVAREALKMENQRITPARFKCLACGDYHEGSGNLPCPKMAAISVTLKTGSYKKRED